MKDVMDSYKLCLKIKLVGESELKVQLVHVDYNAVTKHQLDGYNYHIFRDVDTNLRIWSFDEFLITKGGIKLPQDNLMGDEMVSSYKFETDGERMTYLKNLYKCLDRWACDKNIFKNDASSPIQNNVSVNDQFWFVY